LGVSDFVGFALGGDSIEDDEDFEGVVEVSRRSNGPGELFEAVEVGLLPGGGRDEKVAGDGGCAQLGRVSAFDIDDDVIVLVSKVLDELDEVAVAADDGKDGQAGIGSIVCPEACCCKGAVRVEDNDSVSALLDVDGEIHGESGLANPTFSLTNCNKHTNIVSHRHR